MRRMKRIGNPPELANRVAHLAVAADAQDGTDWEPAQPRLYMRTTDAQDEADRESVRPRLCMRTTDAQD